MPRWTPLCRVANETEAELVSGYLASHEIETDVHSKQFQQYPENLGMLGAVIVRVAENDLARAEELLADLPQAEVDGVPELAADEDEPIEDPTES